MEKVNYFEDKQGCKNNKNILAQLNSDSGEKIFYSCLVVKINRWGLRQDRTFLVSNECLYNIKKDQV